MPADFAPNFTATGIGSVPHLDPDQVVKDICDRLTEMPYWPQLSRRAPIEDMNLMYARALSPLIKANIEKREVLAHPGLSREDALAAFYERLFSGSLESFGLHPDDASGFFSFLKLIKSADEGQYPWLKGHVTGPLTMCASVMGENGKAILYDDELAEAVARGLGVAAAAQAGQMAVLGRPLLMFIDEPFLSGFGSAFTPISREKVIELLGYSLEELRSRVSVQAGVHCCGNTDWAMLIEAGFDVINLDSPGYGQGLLLYPDAVKQLLARGGAVAWGAVPTLEFKGDETAEGLWAGLKELLEAFEAKGVAKEDLRRGSLVSPACGLGPLDEEKARRILELTAGVSRLAKEQY